MEPLWFKCFGTANEKMEPPGFFGSATTVGHALASCTAGPLKPVVSAFQDFDAMLVARGTDLLMFMMPFEPKWC